MYPYMYMVYGIWYMVYGIWYMYIYVICIYTINQTCLGAHFDAYFKRTQGAIRIVVQRSTRMERDPPTQFITGWWFGCYE